jgi:hypothetical protein
MPQEINIAMPADLDLGALYTIRVTGVDATGAVVAGLKVNTTVLTVDFVNAATPGDVGQLVQGDWFLVPGPGS